MKNLMCVLVLSGAAMAASEDFPADSLLPVGWVQEFTEPGFDSDSGSYSYARDARDWLHETLVITEKSGYLETIVTITDREGKYRGGSYQKRNDPVIIFTGHHDSQGRLSRVAYETPQGWFYEDYGYDARGGLISKIRTNAGGIIARQMLWANTYDAAGRLVMSVESDPTDPDRTWNNKRFFDTTGRLLYRHNWSGRSNSVDQWDSTAYVYRPDGRLLESRRYRSADSLYLVVRWEYRVWQVPVLAVRRRPSAGNRNPTDHTGFVHDARGRRITGHPAPFGSDASTISSTSLWTSGK